MTSRGLLAVSLFIGSLLAANALTAKSSFDWSVGTVISGGSVEVKVTVAPCHPVTVTLYVGGREIQRHDRPRCPEPARSRFPREPPGRGT